MGVDAARCTLAMWTASTLLLSMFLNEARCSSDRPLELSDIMPQDKRLYDKMRPPKYKGNATEVLFHVTVMSLDTIDESSMTYTCDVFFAQSWKDNRLRLPDNMTSDYRLLPIEWLTNIWRPDSFFKNAKDVTFQTMTIPNHYIWLWKDRTILYMVKLTLVLSCPMHFKNYPHDTQTCNLEIESISHTTDDLVFIWDPEMPLDVDEGIELPQLELISTKNGDCTTLYSTGKFTCLEVVFRFKRRLGYYLFHTYVPTCLIVIMSWISFWIKPEAVPARVTLGVTSLLTLSTQHANSQKSLPPVSYIKAIDVFMSGCTVFVFLSLMEYALVNIVMGDIADIEKKKSMGISNLILGARGVNPAVLRRAAEKEEMQHHATANNHEEEMTMINLGPGLHTRTLPPPPAAPASTRPSVMFAADSMDRVSNLAPNLAAKNHVQRYGVPCQQHRALFEDDDQAGRREPRLRKQRTADHLLPPEPAATESPMRRGATGASEIKSIVHDVQLKRQKEIRDMMRRKREKAVLVDRISRWLFPTSFILLNIVYWALFGDHELFGHFDEDAEH